MQKHRVALVIPPRGAHGYRDVGMKESLPHIGIAYLAANIDPITTEIKVFDCPAEAFSVRGLISHLKDFDPEIVGFTAMTSQVNDAHDTALAVKQALPDVKTIVGGYHVSAVPEETLNRFTSFDYAVYGEGELTFRELLKALYDGGAQERLRNIPGIVYTHNAITRVTPPRDFIQDLDALNFPAYDLMPMEKYVGFYNMFMTPRRTAALSTGRGCPYKCIFCFKATGNKYRTRSISSVIKEVQRDVDDFGVEEFVITDESFLTVRARVKEFCESILDLGLDKKITWICQGRVDHSEKEILKLMKSAGCRVISYGIESGSPEMLKHIKKGITLERAIDTIRNTKDAGILTDTNFIIGHPGDTRESIKKTVEFSRKLDADMASFALLVPFPGTIIADMAQRGEGGLKLLTNDYAMYGKQVGGAMELESINRAELERIHRNAYLRFYIRPSKIRNLFRVVDLKMLLLMAGHALFSIIKPFRKKKA